MPIFKRREKRDRGYSFDGGKFKISQREAAGKFETLANEAGKKLSALDKTGLIPKEQQEKSQEGWNKLQKNIMDSDGNIKMAAAQREEQQNLGYTPSKDGGFDFSKPIDPSNMSKEDLMKLQESVGAKPDGNWGSGSQRALNLHYAHSGIEPPNAARLNSIFKEAGVVVKPKPDNYDTIGGKKPAYATDELSSGGDVSPRLIESVENSMLGIGIPGLRITAGNDAYHQGDRYSRPGKSAHSKGDALDFTTDNYDETLKKFEEAGYTYEKQQKYRKGKPVKGQYYHIWRSPKGVKPKHRILDEYAGKTANTTGGHFDWKVG